MNTTTSDIDITVIIVNYNTKHLLDEVFDCLAQARANFHLKTIIIDNASTDGSVDYLRSKPFNIQLITNDTNVGFGRANNQALPYIEGEYVLLLNTDAFVAADTLVKTVNYMAAHPKCGILGVKLVGRDGVLQPSCRYFPNPLNIFLNYSGLGRFFKNIQMVDNMQWDHASARPCDWVPGCYYLIRKPLLDEVGLFDPLYFLYYEEVDHCFAAKKMGWEVHYFPDTQVVHIGGESAKSDGQLTQKGNQLQKLNIESELIFFRKNYGLLAVLAHVILSSLLYVINFLKRLLVPNKPRDNVPIGLIWKLLFATLFGRICTR
jgi:GT2 family glycosyltransferase